MNQTSIQQEGDRIVEMFRYYIAEEEGSYIEKYNSTQCAVKHVEGLIEAMPQFYMNNDSISVDKVHNSVVGGYTDTVNRTSYIILQDPYLAFGSEYVGNNMRKFYSTALKNLANAKQIYIKVTPEDSVSDLGIGGIDCKDCPTYDSLLRIGKFFVIHDIGPIPMERWLYKTIDNIKKKPKKPKKDKTTVTTINQSGGQTGVIITNNY